MLKFSYRYNYAKLISLSLVFLLLLVSCNRISNTAPSSPNETPKVFTEGTGLYAEYFSNSDFSGPRMGQIDSQIEFDWGTNSPTKGVLPEAFSARWGGQLRVPESAMYRFSVEALGKASLRINNQGIKNGQSLELLANQVYTIHLEFVKTEPSARLKLSWQKTGSNYSEVVNYKYLNPSQTDVVLSVQNTDLVNNGGFEAGTGNWIGAATTLSSGYNSPTALSAENYAWVQQNLPYSVISAGEYRLSAYAKTIGAGSCKVGIGGGGTNAFDKSMSFNSNTWTQQQLNVSFQSDTVWAGIYLSTDLSACHFDNVRLEKLSDTPTAYDPNVLTNGSFDTTLSAWNQFGGNTNLTAGFNNQAISVSNWAWVQQTLGTNLVSTNKTYTFSLYAKSLDGQDCTAGFVGASANETLFSETLSFNSSSFESKELSVAVTGDIAWSAVYLTGANCVFDELNLRDKDAQAPSEQGPENSPYVSAAVTVSFIQVCWDEAKGASSYALERKTEGAYSLLKTDLAGPCYDDITAEDNIRYTYRVKSVNNLGTSSGAIVEAIRLISAAPADAVLLNSSDIVEYDWTVGCVPTAVGMLMGYWDRNGYPNLIVGDTTYYSEAVINAIASDGHMFDYAYPNGPNSESFADDKGLVQDASETKLFGDRHNNDSIADFLYASRSKSNLDFGYTFNSWYGAGIHGYANYRGYNGFETQRLPFESFSLNDVAANIDAAKPLLFSVNPEGSSANSTHAVMVVGYSRSTNQYAFLAGWSKTTKIRWASFERAAVGVEWGITNGFFVTPKALEGNQFRSLVKDNSGSAASYEASLSGSNMTAKILASNSNMSNSRSLAMANADGHTYYRLYNDGVGTAALYVLYTSGNGIFNYELINADSGISRTNILGLATQDGKTFYYLSDDSVGSAALYSATLNKNGSFTSQLLNADSGASRTTLSFATKDSKSFYQLYNDGNGTAALYKGDLQSNGTFNFQLLDSDSGNPMNTIDWVMW